MFCCLLTSGTTPQVSWSEFSATISSTASFTSTRSVKFGTRNENIAQKSGLTKNAEDLLRVVMIDQPSAASSEAQVMDKLHAFFITLEYLNICEFSVDAGPLFISIWPSSRSGGMKIEDLLCC